MNILPLPHSGSRGEGVFLVNASFDGPDLRILAAAFEKQSQNLEGRCPSNSPAGE
ncbi:MAG: hypothetical protein LBI62_02300 [Candidatus Accumulibacter sp.]|jgi:hypothetical protein|nr:hypothetical protein [Accumulibacter sp.]